MRRGIWVEVRAPRDGNGGGGSGTATGCTRRWVPTKYPVYQRPSPVDPDIDHVPMPPRPTPEHVAYHVYCGSTYLDSVWLLPSAFSPQAGALDVLAIARAARARPPLPARDRAREPRRPGADGHGVVVLGRGLLGAGAGRGRRASGSGSRSRPRPPTSAGTSATAPRPSRARSARPRRPAPTSSTPTSAAAGARRRPCGRWSGSTSAGGSTAARGRRWTRCSGSRAAPTRWSSPAPRSSRRADVQRRAASEPSRGVGVA